MLFSDSGVVKLSDFILDMRVSVGVIDPRVMQIASMYIPPECWKEKKTCLKNDVWTLGICVIEMAEGKNPLADCTFMEVREIMLFDEPLRFTHSGWSSELVDFVSRCLVKDVNERSSVEELLKVRHDLWDER